MRESDIELGPELDAIETSLDRVAALLEAAPLQSKVEAVSAWSVAQQLGHLLLASSSMMKAALLLAEGKIGGAEGTPSAWGQRILSGEGYPRGKGKAPESVVPPAEMDAAWLAASLVRTRSKVPALRAVAEAAQQSGARYSHPLFGPMTAAQWIRITREHAEHHLTIVDEILGA